MYCQSIDQAHSTAEMAVICNREEYDATKSHPLVTLSYLAVAIAGAGGCAALHAMI